MKIEPGARIGPYEIVSLLGQGGMGAVWRARHVILRREDALKIIPEAFATDPAWASRFEREARTLASLNHPNVPPVYGLEHAGTQRVLVMELVEGRTLASFATTGPMAIERALSVARQIAEALDAAHSSGIVHRDLKPDNVMVTSAGVVKVLDFGLARTVSGPLADRTNGETVSLGATESGAVLGTIPYMSPEQARGADVDKRTDIWAFGCVVFELLAGKRAFGQRTTADLMAAILEREPDWSALPDRVPASVVRLLRRSLEKDLNRRLRDIGDARVEIEDALAELALSGPQNQPRPPAAPSAKRALVALVGALLVAIAALVATSFRRPLTGELVRETRLDVVTPPTDNPASFALSPDGRRLAFVARDGATSKLWLRALNEATARPLAGTDGADYSPFWSPNGRSIAFFSGSTAKRLDLESGGVTEIVPGPRYGTWGSTGTLLLGFPTGPLQSRAADGGGQPAAATVLVDGQVQHWHPSFLPDGRRFLFYASVGPSVVGRGIFLGSLESPASRPKLVVSEVKNGSPAAYLPPGWLLFVRGDSLLAQPFDAGTGQLSGAPVRMADQMGSFEGSGPALSVSDTGVIAYRANAGVVVSQLTWFDRAGRALGTLGDPGSLSDPELAPDGARALARTYLVDGIRTTQQTARPSLKAIWSPDGQRLVFGSVQDGRIHLFRKAPMGSGDDDAQLLFKSDSNTVPADWSPDGRYVIFNSLDTRDAMDLWVLPMTGEPAPVAWLKTRFVERGGQFSPDGRFVVYQSNESGRFEIYIRSFAGAMPASGAKWYVSRAGGVAPRWSADGGEIYYLAPDGSLMAVPIAMVRNQPSAGKPVALFQTRIKGGGTSPNEQQYDVARDGRFLINVVNTDDAPITIIQNWSPRGADAR